MPYAMDIESPKKANEPKAKETTINEPDQLQLGKPGKVRIIKLKNVVNKRIASTESAGLGPTTFIKPTPFIGQSMVTDTFNIKEFIGYCNVDAAAAYLSDSKEIKVTLLKSENVTLQVAAENKLIVYKDLHHASATNIVTFNKACAIMALSLLKFQLDEMFDWDKKKYVDAVIKEKKFPDRAVVNRLAGQLGIPNDHPYYWLCVPGYEFLFDVYPAEVIAYTLVRLEYRDKMKIKDEQTDQDIVNSLTAKINRKFDLNTTPPIAAMEQIGMENIRICYKNFVSRIEMTGRDMRNTAVVNVFGDLIKKFTDV